MPLAQTKSHEVARDTTYWEQFRKHIIGQGQTFVNEHGERAILYADWIASGRLYGPIEETLTQKIGGVVANPHSYSSYTGANITALYKEARANIKRHVNANQNDVLVTVGSGMTDALMRLQEILGLKEGVKIRSPKPVIFITHMEHHSNQVSWMECEVDVVVVPPNAHNEVGPEKLREELGKYKDRKLKIGAFSACSNVTGIINPIHKLAKVMHESGGYCFADYAASAPYVDIDMHPENPEEDLDAIYFSPHKFLGGPGSC
ncbi:aminotransferase class V-fold PLP-dependent enzyme, partial [Reichenbachiella sp.]